MLPIFSLFGLALAAAFWPEPQTATDGAAMDDDSSEGPELTASETLGHSDTVLSFATSDIADETDTLSASAEADDEDYQDDLIDPHDAFLTGTDGPDVLLGLDGDDVLTGGDGADVLDGGTGDDLIYGDDDQDADTLIGGEGHDQIWVGDGDTATGGRGDDVFHMDAEGIAYITDYNPDDDRVELIYDPAGPVPELTTETTDDGVNLLADGDLVAVFNGSKVIDVSRVAMVSEAA